MNRSAQIQQLPLALAVALRLHEAGAETRVIASALGIEPEGVAPLLDLARMKLDRISRDDSRPKVPNQAGHATDTDLEGTDESAT